MSEESGASVGFIWKLNMLMRGKELVENWFKMK